MIHSFNPIQDIFENISNFPKPGGTTILRFYLIYLAVKQIYLLFYILYYIIIILLITYLYIIFIIYLAVNRVTFINNYCKEVLKSFTNTSLSKYILCLKQRALIMYLSKAKHVGK